ncbi:diaminobutyrate acetyltransferase [Spongiibacter sp. KMU-158]|uniref:L-2,4-diaminobutyric acid acetyltransferase n=1 Tax=Spongiibacter pelagi TaxID=2760804 RepID=A0A927GUN7_9GAMM|nr:diaminobutyrate acetyltransferase [Spongiibacter pelagi]
MNQKKALYEALPPLRFRAPSAEDGHALNQLVAASPPLDPNSVYCNLLQCSHFADTAVAVEEDGQLVGFISGYIPPQKPDTVFVWQVVVDSSQRGRGLAKRMLHFLVERPACVAVRYMETTITPDNEASWALFRSFARDRETELNHEVWFEKDTHFAGQHDSEELLRIGPF